MRKSPGHRSPCSSPLKEDGWCIIKPPVLNQSCLPLRGGSLPQVMFLVRIRSQMCVPGANRTRDLQRRDALPETRVKLPAASCVASARRRVKNRDVDEKYMRMALREAERANREGKFLLELFW